MPDVGLAKEVVIMDGDTPYAAISNAGASSLAFDMANKGFGDFLLELKIKASGAVDALNCKLLPRQMGTEATFLTEALESLTREPIAPDAERVPYAWVMANTEAYKTVQIQFHDVWAHQLKLHCASAGATNTWEVTAKVQRMKRVPYAVSHT